MNGKRIVEVRFFGDKTLLHGLIENQALKPIMQGRRVVFSLADVAILTERISELENTLREMAGNIKAALREDESA